MQFQPVHALITRESKADPSHEALRDVPGVIASAPEVGSPLQVFLESGKVMRTSVVKEVSRRGSDWVINTANSQYRLKVSNAA